MLLEWRKELRRKQSKWWVLYIVRVMDDTSFTEGNVFISACLSTGGCTPEAVDVLQRWRGVLQRAGCIPEVGLCTRGGGVNTHTHTHTHTYLPRIPPHYTRQSPHTPFTTPTIHHTPSTPPLPSGPEASNGSQCSGGYAFYWNAFLSHIWLWRNRVQ